MAASRGRRRAFRGAVAVVTCAVCLAGAFPAAAQEDLPALPADGPVPLASELIAMAKGAQIFSFGLVASVDLPPITGTEVLGGAGGSVDLGTFTPGGDVTGGITLTTRLDRVVDVVWAGWFRDLKKVKDITVQYQVIGARGGSGRLEAPDPAAGYVGVEATPLKPQVVFKFGRWRYVVGGALFTVDLAGARGAGRFEGQLQVSVFTL